MIYAVGVVQGLFANWGEDQFSSALRVVKQVLPVWEKKSWARVWKVGCLGFK